MNDPPGPRLNDPAGPRTGSRQVVLALGSNLGDRLAHIQAGIDFLAAASGITQTAVSAVFETTPFGGPDVPLLPAQPDYLNAVLLAVSDLPALDILGRCQAAEKASGRVRTERWGPRTLDIDIITCGAETSDDPRLTLPHPRAHQRAFVLLPWHDVDRDALLPGYGRVAGLIARLGAAPAGTTAGAAAEAVRRRRDLRLTTRAQARANQGR